MPNPTLDEDPRPFEALRLTLSEAEHSLTRALGSCRDGQANPFVENAIRAALSQTQCAQRELSNPHV